VHLVFKLHLKACIIR